MRALPSTVRLWVAGAAFAAMTIAVPASAHVERPAYFPNPAAEKAGKQKAGGKAPKARTLGSALKSDPPGETRVVCQDDSLELLRESVARARKRGYLIRPTDHRSLGRKRAARLIEINEKLAKRCRYDEIQPAVTDSGNNDRVVVMPGLYTEPTSRSQPTHDPACADLLQNGDPPSRSGALSYRYQEKCPNDQNLIAVIGRRSGGPAPDPPLHDREGIPDVGKCVRCNLQLEGSGVSADDVIVESGDPAAGNAGPSGIGSAKDVAIRADRADGFVLRNLTTRHAAEHGIYVIEADGFRLDRFKAFYNGLYGTLTFASDHGVHSNCEGAGHGDSAIYPGAPPDTGEQGKELGVVSGVRLNNVVKLCDMHHNLAGYSATNGNAVHVTRNNMYDNTLGFNTDAVTAPGHPGFPGDTSLVEDNNFFSNNFNPYVEDSDVEAAFPYPTGTGLWIAGGNHHTVRENNFWDNWRRGTMVFSVPDALVCGPDSDNEQRGCDASRSSTSHFNDHNGNRMGFVPEEFRDPKLAAELDITNGGPNGEARQQNGTDFWWDDFAGAEGNCWFANESAFGQVTMSPRSLPTCNDGQDPSTSTGIGSPTNEGELLSCLAAFINRDQGGLDPETSTCPWLRTPARPGSAAARADAAEQADAFTRVFEECGAGQEPLIPVLSGGCERDTAPAVAPQAASPIAAGDLGSATCSTWNASTPAGRAAIVVDLRGFAGSEVEGAGVSGTGRVLDDQVAHELFETRCAPEFADSFLLYKMYEYAAVIGARG
jgi:hypothetical protein